MASKVSVVVTVRNEGAHIGALLESLVGQGLHEVVLVDAKSTDETVAMAKAFQDTLPLRIIEEPCLRGRGRNIGAAVATGDVLAFIDGDCRAAPGWIAAFQDAHDGSSVLAGRTNHVGPNQFPRVPVMVEGQDATWPSCNLAYPKSLFDSLGGFDDRFHTAEDVDLNLRAIASGARIRPVPSAIVEADTRATIRGLVRQAYAYGKGRRQLEAKHPQLPRTSKRAALRSHRSPKGLLRLAAGWLGHARHRDSP